MKSSQRNTRCQDMIYPHTFDIFTSVIRDVFIEFKLSFFVLFQLQSQKLLTEAVEYPSVSVCAPSPVFLSNLIEKGQTWRRKCVTSNHFLCNCPAFIAIFCPPQVRLTWYYKAPLSKQSHQEECGKETRLLHCRTLQKRIDNNLLINCFLTLYNIFNIQSAP